MTRTGSGCWGHGWSPRAPRTGSRTSAPSGLQDKVLAAHVGLGWLCCHPRPRVLTDTQSGQRAGFMAKKTSDEKLKEPKQLSAHPVLKGLEMVAEPRLLTQRRTEHSGRCWPDCHIRARRCFLGHSVRRRRDHAPPWAPGPGRQRARPRSLQDTHCLTEEQDLLRPKQHV